jgi:hypothetical protein
MSPPDAEVLQRLVHCHSSFEVNDVRREPAGAKLGDIARFDEGLRLFAMRLTD